MTSYIFSAVLLFSTYSFATLATPATSGTPASIVTKDWPDHVLKGSPVQLGDAKTKLIVLDFWASWCEPCRESLPYYSSLQKKYGTKGVKFLGISTDDTEDDAKKFLKVVKFDFPAVWDKGRHLTDVLHLQAIPALVILSKDGKFLDQENGYNKNLEENLPKKIEALLKSQE